MKKINLKALVTLVLAVIISTTVKAGFPIGNGRWLLVPTYTSYNASQIWDVNGLSVDPNSSFNSTYLGLFGGYGIGRDLDFVFNIPYLTQNFTENGNALQPFSTLGDVSVGLSYFLNHYDYYKHLSITGSIIFPAYDATNVPPSLVPGFGSTGIEVKMGIAGTNTKKFKNTYYDVEGGVRQYFNTGGPTMFFGNATLGVPINDDWKISGTLNAVVASSSSLAINTVNPNLNRNFGYFRGTIAIGRKLNRNISLWGSIFRDFFGYSIGQGNGYSIFAVIKF
jgi:protein XagA